MREGFLIKSTPTDLLLREKGILPGFPLAMGFTLVYLGLMMLLPLTMMLVQASQIGWNDFWDTVLSPRVLSAYRVSFGLSFVAAIVNSLFGSIVAWVLARYHFIGKGLLDSLIDLPFALPTAIAGIALTSLYAEHGWLGSILTPLGIKVAFTPAGIVVALIFVSLPFTVRTLEPVLREMDREEEEAAASLGASRLQTLARIILPKLYPALLTGFAMAFARALGEYGSVIFIAGNIPLVSEIAPLLIATELEEFNDAAATSIALVMLIVSFVMLLVINRLQRWKVG